MVALYIHWPFCESKCPYCDFNSHVRESIDQNDWQEAFKAQIFSYAALLGNIPISSLFFGGGTPSLMSPELVYSIIHSLKEAFPSFNGSTEITLEANPGSVEAKKFAAFAEAGINRVSLGIQALNDTDLQFLGRKHSLKEAYTAIDIASTTFKRFSIDLIYARPGQTLLAWKKELKEALGLIRDHISLYQLTIEKGTPFFQAEKQRDFILPSEQECAELFEITQEMTTLAGLPAYEISNHATPGQESQHNLSYWHYDDYLGIGPGAHSRITLQGKKHALMMYHRPEVWLEMVKKGASPVQQSTPLTLKEMIEEYLLMGLRLEHGINKAAFFQKTGKVLTEIIPLNCIEPLLKEELLIVTNTHLKVTPQGKLVLNQITKFLIESLLE